MRLGYRYVSKVYHGSITIGAGSVFGNATIPPMGPFAILIYLGQVNTSATNQSSIISPAINLLTSTQVGATRNAVDAGSVTIYFAVVDATSDLVDQIEYNSAAFAGTNTKTTTLANSFDLARSAVFWLGNFSSDTSAVPARRTNARFTAVNQVTATSNSTHTGTTRFVCVQFKAGVIQSVQQVSDAYATANATDTKTISAVVQANVWIAFGGVNTGGSGYYEIQLTSATNINLVRTATSVASRTPAYTVIEFVSGVIKSNQNFAISLLSAAQADATVSSVNTARALANFSGYNNTSTDTPDKIFSGCTLLDATHVRAFVNTNSATAKGLAGALIEFN